MTLNQLFWKLTKEKFHPSWGYFGRSSKNIYNLPKIMLHITPWTLILMLHIRQSIHLVLTNVLSTSFLFIWSALHSMKLAQHCQYNSGKGRCTWYMWNNDMFVLWNRISAIFMKIENALYTPFQNSTFLFINGLIFDIMIWTFKITSLLNLNE